MSYLIHVRTAVVECNFKLLHGNIRKVPKKGAHFRLNKKCATAYTQAEHYLWMSLLLLSLVDIQRQKNAFSLKKKL